MNRPVVLVLVLVLAACNPIPPLDPDGSRAWLADFDPKENALLVWVVTAFCVMLDGPYRAYAKYGKEE